MQLGAIPGHSTLKCNHGFPKVETPPREAVFEQIERLAASEQFVRSRRLIRFLRFTAENTLTGKTDGLTEYAIGTKVYDRSSDFDPAAEGIVRAETHRLRAKLDKHYQSAGRFDPIRVEYPAGSYIPVFH